MDEFALIQQYFSSIGTPSKQVVLGIGDDCALLAGHTGEQLAISVDTSLPDRHFPAQADPWAIGWRALAVAFSDLSAMAAEPVGFTLALSLPEQDPVWLQAFSQGLRAFAEAQHCPLIGGDTTRGPLSISVQVIGRVPAHRVWRRQGAQVGDVIAVLGDLGAAYAGLQSLLADPPRAQDRHQWNAIEQAYMLPASRMQEALRLREQVKVSACIDISDGLLADCQHLLAASAVAAELDLAALPIHPWLKKHWPIEQQQFAACEGGDDYALLLTLPSAELPLARQLCPHLTVIGRCVAGAGMHNQVGERLAPRGFKHF
ncbi:thiamine-phosphate kinase [Marinospirillum sp.]|uniref:thiamine-phosphate kinase n=1 Tax=Marinospirillum sp. TaxID=2183934 RepID=UPI003A8BCB02